MQILFNHYQFIILIFLIQVFSIFQLHLLQIITIIIILYLMLLMVKSINQLFFYKLFILLYAHILLYINQQFQSNFIMILFMFLQMFYINNILWLYLNHHNIIHKIILSKFFLPFISFIFRNIINQKYMYYVI